MRPAGRGHLLMAVALTPRHRPDEKGGHPSRVAHAWSIRLGLPPRRAAVDQLDLVNQILARIEMRIQLETGHSLFQ